jgi:hypothetical protein
MVPYGRFGLHLELIKPTPSHNRSSNANTDRQLFNRLTHEVIQSPPLILSAWDYQHQVSETASFGWSICNWGRQGHLNKKVWAGWDVITEPDLSQMGCPSVYSTASAAAVLAQVNFDERRDQRFQPRKCITVVFLITIASFLEPSTGHLCKHGMAFDVLNPWRQFCNSVIGGRGRGPISSLMLEEILKTATGNSADIRRYKVYNEQA